MFDAGCSSDREGGLSFGSLVKVVLKTRFT